MVAIKISTGKHLQSQRGFSLIEVVISIALMGILAVGLLGAFGHALTTFMLTDSRETAKNFLESKMEEVLAEDYLPDYSDIANAAKPGEYADYGLAIEVDNNIVSANETVKMQKITVLVTHNNREYRLEDYKVSR